MDWTIWLSSKLGVSVLVPQALDLQMCAPISPAFYADARDCNAGPHTCATGILLTGSPQLLIFILG